MPDTVFETKRDAEKILLVIIEFKGKHSDFTTQEIEQEMRELVVACGGEVVDTVTVKIIKPSASFFIGEGRVHDIAGLCSIKEVDTVIFSHDLKGSQQRNLEEIIKIKLIDRTQLILDIFARRAVSQEGKIQVELAQLEYLLPRLVGKGVELSRLGGGIGTLGPGETKLEMDRRRIAQRIAKLKRGLKDIEASRDVKRKQRKNKGVPTISLVGYTNAGKSTLLNRLTQAGQDTKDGLFTTLDSLSRQMILPNHQKVIISDTVGFMRELPHQLIESFKATLEEVREADFLLHVLDVSHPNFRAFQESVLTVLNEIGIKDKPMITVLNKIDRVNDPRFIEELRSNFEDAVPLCAKTGENIDELVDVITQKLSSLVVEINVTVPIDRMDLVNLAHEQGEVYSIKYYEDSINIRASVPTHIAGKFDK